MEDDPDQNDDAAAAGETPPESLLPYDEWTEQALRQVAVSALRHAAAHGLPGAHHFYISFRTDHPETVIPARLKTQYPREMTIVLQHQFWDLAVDDEAVSVGLSFGGVPAALRIPYAAITAFNDPHVHYGLRFRVEVPEPAPEPKTSAEPAATEAGAVVSLDAFRRKPTPKS